MNNITDYELVNAADSLGISVKTVHDLLNAIHAKRITDSANTDLTLHDGVKARMLPGDWSTGGGGIITAIKWYREQTGCDLHEAKDFVDKVNRS